MMMMQVASKHDERQPSAAELLQHLDNSLLVQILDYVSVWDARKLLMSRPTLWAVARPVESQRLECQVENALQVRYFSYRNLERLQTLDIESWATDDFLRTNQNLMPNLQHVSMVSSEGVSDAGLSLLGQGEARRQNLRYIDITFCPNISYGATLTLRANLNNGVVIRRQPKWMDGRFETPFPNDGIHTYWADGSFSFERADASCGFVRQVVQWDPTNPYYVGDKVQFSNFDPPAGWPSWARYFYRPGVSLLYLPEADNEGKTILVAQARYGIFPPEGYPKEEHRTLPVGETKYFDREGQLLSNETSDRLRHVMITRMRVLPLDNLMPPQHVVDCNAEFLERYNSTWGLDEEGLEDSLHRMLGGRN